MTEKKRIVALVGSYRKNGTVDTLTDELLAAAQGQGAVTEKIYLQDVEIQFCTNCRHCMQEPGQQRGSCIFDDGDDDGMSALLDRLDSADGVVFGAPVNLGAVNALTKRFMERCAGYVYWPWGALGPKPRKKSATRKAAIISTSAAPAFINNRAFGFNATASLRELVNFMGLEFAGTLKAGGIIHEDGCLKGRAIARARKLGRQLAA